MMKTAFGDECMSKTQIKDWYKRFKDGRTSVDSNPRSGRPSTTKTPGNIERVQLAINEDRRLTVRELECDLGIPKTSVWKILTENLQMVRVCAKFIPKLLTVEQKNLRLEIAQDNLEMVSPDVAPCDFWLFPRLKMPLKGHRFDDKETVETNTTNALKAIPKNEFQDCFQKWKGRWKRILQSNGDYFEGCYQPDDAE